jgi:hypothetical protein
MAQALKRRTARQEKKAGSNILSLVVIALALLGGFYYVFPALTSDDWLWFSTAFDETPREITIIERGERTTLTPDDPRFAAITAAFNQSIVNGYRASSLGFSDKTWDVINEHGLLVEMVYAEPVRLHLRGGFAPKERLLLLVDGAHPGIHTTRTLFGSDDGNWSGQPVLINDVAPLQQALAQAGYDLGR